MLVTQTLSSGVIIRQDFTQSVRLPFYETDHDEWVYATHGGTVFLVVFHGRPYGLTCRHVFGDFDPDRLFIAQDKAARKGTPPGRIAGFAYPSAPRDGAVGTDIEDLCVIYFRPEVRADFFTGAYVIDDRTIADSQAGHRLRVAGALKDKTTIVPPDITAGYAQLEFQDDGPFVDPFLRTAKAKFDAANITEITGMSGSPVFSDTAKALCGMVVRGGISEGLCRIYFMEASDIVRFLDAVNRGAASNYYLKSQPRR
ncbi:hypothetical protein [Phenylobacterium montanum]|uniref:Serine protease n=1 Tax=Phenylobacterium montanum TaxID=2823693 RepID=A0A975G2C1_9CAUL|nr:hypothetical protein [Caulobacter sp. S6]QUD89848.1 hypothetical protein KCG34_08255 [Caulobacter sp. S6]